MMLRNFADSTLSLYCWRLLYLLSFGTFYVQPWIFFVFLPSFLPSFPPFLLCVSFYVSFYLLLFLTLLPYSLFRLFLQWAFDIWTHFYLNQIPSLLSFPPVGFWYSGPLLPSFTKLLPSFPSLLGLAHARYTIAGDEPKHVIDIVKAGVFVQKVHNHCLQTDCLVHLQEGLRALKLLIFTCRWGCIWGGTMSDVLWRQ